ncbi:MAG: Spy/CpxP family protein refolding chaperone [Rhodospirillales bacterium]|nr:Spy/CpxP family protein refolding chaperone [Rhodospirillales bacterium]
MTPSRDGRRVLLLGALAVLAGGAGLAAAQPAMRGRMMGGGMGGRAWGPMGGPGMGRGVTDMPGYLDALKAQLGITKAEEPAWKDYAETVSGVAGQMQGLHQAMRAQMPQASWAERRQQMEQMFEAHRQAADTVHTAADKLLGSLDPSQRATATAILPGLRGGMMAGPGMSRPIPPSRQ